MCADSLIHRFGGTSPKSFTIAYSRDGIQCLTCGVRLATSIIHFVAGVDVPMPGILLGFDGVPQEACASFRVIVGFVVVVILIL